MANTVSILGCGWLGKSLGSSLSRKGYLVSGSTTSLQKVAELENEGIRPFLLKIDPEISLENQMEFFCSQILIICIPPKRKSGMGEQYVKQIENVAKACKIGSTQNVILISSTSVYPDNNQEVTEADLTETEENVMVKAENIIRGEKDFSSTIIRFAGLTGPERHPGRFFAGKSDVNGADTPVNLIHRDDCVAIIEKIIEKESWGEVYNACSDSHPKKKEFYTAAAKSIKLTPPEFSSSVQNFKIINSDKIKTKLNYTFKYSDPFQMI